VPVHFIFSILGIAIQDNQVKTQFLRYRKRRKEGERTEKKMKEKK
jgi:hypothetical protein